jgi:hypothetical protein
MYRVFVSYSHQDLEFVQRVVKIIEDNGLMPMWDSKILPGAKFSQRIKNFIAHSHVFMPVITKKSDERKWFHHEIGYATALNIPILPLAVGKLHGGMIEQIQALQVTEKELNPLEVSEDLNRLREELSQKLIEKLVEENSDFSNALYQCAEFAQNRAAMMAKYCNSVATLGYLDIVRQKGGLSSFHIPDKTIHHPIWKDRYGRITREEEHCRLQREERRAFDKHAKSEGCKIIINPYIPFKEYGKKARIVRLQSLLEFLESMPDNKCQVAFHRNMKYAESLTILGDWFSAESVSARVGKGFRQTIFTRHAPSINKKIADFDSEFDEYLEDLKWKAETSRLSAIEAIEKIVAELRN